MYRRILLPTDGSPPTERALEYALDLVETYDAELHVLHVLDTTATAGDVETESITEEYDDISEDIVENVVARVHETGLERVVDEVRRGPPPMMILEYTDEHDVDLIVMGTHGRTGIDRYLLGSVTEKIVRQSEVPVLTVRHPES